jgi:hypothetical protein
MLLYLGAGSIALLLNEWIEAKSNLPTHDLIGGTIKRLSHQIWKQKKGC